MKHHQEFFGENPPLVEAGNITELALSEYSHENLRIASKDWTEPVIVRKMFANSPARNWVKSKDDISGLESISNFKVSIV